MMLSEVDAPLSQPGARVDLRHAVPPHLEVQVGAGGLATVPDLGDLLAALDLLAFADGEGVHVAVDLDGSVVELDTHPQPESAGRSGVDDDSVGGGVDRRADRVRDVDAVVGRAPPGAEARGERA